MKIFDLYAVYHMEPKEIAARFDISTKAVIYTINNFYAYKLRHDPALRRHCRDQIKSSLQLLMSHYMPHAMANGGKEARECAKSVLSIAKELSEMYGLKTHAPPEKENANNTQNNFYLAGGGITPDSSEMLDQIQKQIAGV